VIDLSAQCGLPVAIDEDRHRLLLDDALLIGTIYQRRLDELRPVLYDQTVDEPKRLYTLFNGVTLPDDRQSFAEAGLRYDLAVVPPIVLGEEYIKTLGHYHSMCRHADVRYAEAYEIIHGRARFLLQVQDADDPHIVKDVVVVEARAGDRLIMPSDYAHVTINPGPEALVMANIIATDCTAVHADITEMGGFCHYNLVDINGLRFVRNLNYANPPPIRSASLMGLQRFGLAPSQPSYTSLHCDPSRFEFLLNPGRFRLRLEHLITEETGVVT